MGVDPGQVGDPGRPGLVQFGLTGLERGTGARQRLLFGGDLVAGRFDRQLRLAQLGNQRLDFVAQVADAVDDRLVHAANAVEVFGAGRQILHVARGDDHAEHVRTAHLVHRHQPFAQHRQRSAQARAHLFEPADGAVEPLDRAVELGLLGGKASFGVGLATPDRRHLRGQAVDLAAVAGDRRGQHALLFANFVELGLGRVELFLQVLGPTGATKSSAARAATATHTAIATGRFLSIAPRLAKPEIRLASLPEPATRLAIPTLLHLSPCGRQCQARVPARSPRAAGLLRPPPPSARWCARFRTSRAGAARGGGGSGRGRCRWRRRRGRRVRRSRR